MNQWIFMIDGYGMKDLSQNSQRQKATNQNTPQNDRI